MEVVEDSGTGRVGDILEVSDAVGGRGTGLVLAGVERCRKGEGWEEE